MKYRAALILAFVFGVTAVHGTDCSFGTSKNIFEDIVHRCPGILDSSDKSFCCIDISHESIYCCDAEEFALKTGLGIIIPAIITVVVVVSVIVFCISCLCCSCCPWYRRRHRGTVYGKVQTPGVVTVVQPGMLQTVPQPPAPYTTYPAVHAASSLPAQPPPYTTEAYVKQPAYNPNYQQ